MTDTDAMNGITAYLNRPGPWNGGDVCEVVAGIVRETGRVILDNADGEATCAGCGAVIEEEYGDDQRALCRGCL